MQLTPYTITIYGVIAGKEYVIHRSACTKWGYIWANTPAGEFGDPDLTIVTGYRMPTAHENVLIDFEEGSKADNSLAVLGNLDSNSFVLPFTSVTPTGFENKVPYGINVFQLISQIATTRSIAHQYVTAANEDGSSDIILPLTLHDPRMVLSRKGVDAAILKQFGFTHLRTYMVDRDDGDIMRPNIVVECRVPSHMNFINGYY